MPKIYINKLSEEPIALPVITEKVVASDLKKAMEKKLKLGISELVSLKPNFPGGRDNELTKQEKINNILFLYENLIEDLDEPEIRLIWDRVKLDIAEDVTIEELIEEEKNKVLFIDDNQMCIITSKSGYSSTHTNPTKRVILGDIENEKLTPLMFTMWWKPMAIPIVDGKSIVSQKKTGYTQIVQDSSLIYNMGWELILNSNGKLTFNVYALDIGEGTQASWSVECAQTVKLDEWQYVQFGVDNGSIKIKMERKDDSFVYEETTIGKDLDDYYWLNWDILNAWGSYGYVFGLGPIFEDFYFKYPQMIFGGVNILDESSFMGDAVSKIRYPVPTTENPVAFLEYPENKVWSLKTQDCVSLRNALDSYYVSSIRCYTGVVSMTSLDEDKFLLSMETNPLLASLNSLNISFNTDAEDNVIQDMSPNPNEAILTGDKKIKIAGDDYNILDTNRAKLVNLKGPL